MRIIADKPMELLRALVDEHLTRVVPLDGIKWLTDDSEPIPDPSRYFTIPSELLTAPIPATTHIDPARFVPADLKSLNSRIVLHGPEGHGVRFDVVAAIGPDIPTEPTLFLVTSDGTVVLALHTEAAIHPDGVIQISGAEPSISLLTIPQLRAQRGKKLLLDSSCVRSFAVERRTDGGPWYPVPVQFNPRAIALRELRED